MNRCPSSQQLEQLLDERLPDAESRAVSQHVSECTACQAVLERLTADSEVSSGSLSVVMLREGNGNRSTVKEPLTPFLARLKEKSALAILTPSRPGGADVGSARLSETGSTSAESSVP